MKTEEQRKKHSFAEQCPQLCYEWDHEKNLSLGLSPESVSSTSNMKVWWICSNHHSWQATIAHRKQGTGCPFCSGRMVISGVNDLLTLFPEIAAEWNIKKNGSLTPSNIKAHSSRIVWWQCKKGHEWEAPVSNRTGKLKSGCPFCAGKRALSGDNDLATLLPEIAASWHPTLNGNITPSMVRPHSNSAFWWKCSKGHEWKAVVSNRSMGNGCPVCAGIKVQKGFNDLETLYPEVAKEWNFEKNSGVLPSCVNAHSSKKTWWICAKNHEWEATIVDRTKAHHGCPFCSGRRVLPGENDLATVNPRLSNEWHPKKNGELHASDVLPFSQKKVWWQCANKHEWQSTVANRSYGNGCPFCAGKQVIRGINDLETVEPQLANEWHPSKNGMLKPYNVISGSETKVWWLGVCGHEWKATIYSRKAGRGCPVCRGLKVIKGINDFATLQPECAKEWHFEKNKPYTPDMFPQKSEKTFWWKCKYGHEWKTSIATRTTGHGCPRCHKYTHSSFPEQTIYFYVHQLFPDAINGYREGF